jgi:hypothetical protein
LELEAEAALPGVLAPEDGRPLDGVAALALPAVLDAGSLVAGVAAPPRFALEDHDAMLGGVVRLEGKVIEVGHATSSPSGMSRFRVMACAR